MRSLPLAARCYLIVIWSVAALLIAFVLFRFPPSLDQIPLLFLWLALYVLSDYFEVEFAKGLVFAFEFHKGNMSRVATWAGNKTPTGAIRLDSRDRLVR